jgi:N-acetylglucosaminyldiphosphoundecaprenol N-acetyl-beta-D-mannosaminyltransferase
MRVDGTSYEDAARRVVRWTHEKRQAYVCIGTVHMVMEAFDSRAFQRTVNGADLVTPDGMPLVWVLKTLGVKDASRVYGPNLMLRIAAQAAREDVPIGLYGGTPESLETLQKVLEEWFPGIKVACKIAPPFRPLTPEEDEAVTKEIIESGARILFVGIGCPKQEKWMAEHKERLPVVMLGVGAAFDFHTGRVHQAPGWMQAAGLEWMFRLMMDPRRLWKRYAKHNSRFVGLVLLQLLGLRRFDRQRQASVGVEPGVPSQNPAPDARTR